MCLKAKRCVQETKSNVHVYVCVCVLVKHSHTLPPARDALVSAEPHPEPCKHMKQQDFNTYTHINSINPKINDTSHTSLPVPPWEPPTVCSHSVCDCRRFHRLFYPAYLICLSQGGYLLYLWICVLYLSSISIYCRSCCWLSLNIILNNPSICENKRLQ